MSFWIIYWIDMNNFINCDTRDYIHDDYSIWTIRAILFEIPRGAECKQKIKMWEEESSKKNMGENKFMGGPEWSKCSC